MSAEPLHQARPTSRMLFFAIFCLAVMATVIAYYGTRGAGTATLFDNASDQVPLEPGDPVVSISLPHFDADLPPGPHRAVVQTACNICHSAQLILNQPHFPRKKWEETIHKMVVNYGAPVPEAEQQDILEYLTAIRGSE